MSNILHSPNPNALESPFITPAVDRPTPDVCAMDRFTRLCMLSLHPTMCLHHPVLGRGCHIVGSNNPPRIDRSTVSAIKNAKRSRGSNGLEGENLSATVNRDEQSSRQRGLDAFP
jgi:hypothetical protein